MIKIQELRIGNWVQMQCDSKTFITKIDVGDFMDISRGYKAVAPIRLTEDILRKCDFLNRSFYVVGAGNSLKWQLNDFILLKNMEAKFYLPTMPKNVVLESLHQLQNIYFALTLNELHVSNLTEQ